MTQTQHTHSQPSAREDFYRHVNGAWIDSFEIPDDRAGDGVMRELYDRSEEAVRGIITQLGETANEAPSAAAQKVANLYASFMDTDTLAKLGTTPLAPFFEAITQAQSHAELARVTGTLQRDGLSGPFGLFVSADAKDSERYALYVTQGGISLPDESYYREDSSAEVRAKFVDYVATMARLAGLEERTSMSPADLGAAVLDLESQFAAHHWDRVTNRDAEKTYNPHSAADFFELARGFDMAGNLAAIGVSAQQDHFIVSQPSAIDGQSKVWGETELSVLKAWLCFKVVSQFAAYLNDDFVEAHFHFYGRVLSGTPNLRERWKRAVSTVEDLLGEVVGELYVEKYFPASAKVAIEELVEKLIQAYRESIETLDWMGTDTKARAFDKLALFKPKVGYPDVWREYDFDVAANDLVGNVIAAAQAETHRQLARVGGPIDRTEWLMTPQTVNAYYHPVMNEIVFPAAILQPPFFDPAASEATNFGAIGAVIGHEIGHGFDDQGSRYDGQGNLFDWWTAADRERFEQRAGGLIEQFDVLVPAGLDSEYTVNGSLTIGENIGDLGGLGIAWKALLITYRETGHQLTDADAEEFFRSWARVWRTKFRVEERKRRLSVDPHSPEEFRCNQIVKNLDAFHAAFGTEPGDGMWLAPEERVTIW